MLEVGKWKSRRRVRDQYSRNSSKGKPSPGAYRETWAARHVQSALEQKLIEGALGRYSLCMTSALWIYIQASSDWLRDATGHQSQRLGRPAKQGALAHLHYHIWPRWHSESNGCYFASAFQPYTSSLMAKANLSQKRRHISAQHPPQPL